MSVDQATVSRRLASLEEELSVRLVDRLPRQARLTVIGETILASVIDVEERMLSVQRMCLTSNSEVRAKVSITAPPILARHFLAPNINVLSKLQPQVQLAIMSEPHFVSLSRLEADLALRLSPSAEDTDIIRKIGVMEFSLYAAKTYEKPDDPDDWGFIGYTERQADFEHKKWLYDVIGARKVICEVTDLSNQYEAACSGIGVAGLPCFLADRDDQLVRLPNDLDMLSLDIWIAMHPDRRGDSVVRKTQRAIADLLDDYGLGLA
jgi:DNA-binding transcriptional LysR family regulator